MTDQTLTLPLDAELAEAYQSASEDEREKIRWVMNLFLRQMLSPHKRNLMEIMDAMSDSAEANGLTDEILTQLL